MPTYYLIDSTGPTGLHASTGGEMMIDSIAGVTTWSNVVNLSSNNAVDSNKEAFTWTSTTSVPNNASWPSGKYTAVLNCLVAGASVTYGLVALSSVTGHFARVNAALSAHQESTVQANAAFSGTGLKTSSRTWTPAAGLATDRLEIQVCARNTGTMASCMSLQWNDSQVSVVMPSSVAPSVPPHRLGLTRVGR